LYEKLEAEYGKDISSDQLTKLIATKVHDTVEGQQYMDNFGSPSTDGKTKQTLNHMISDKDCRTILTFYVNDALQADEKNKFAAKRKIAEPGNVRIGDAKKNSQIKSKPDLVENCDFGVQKVNLIKIFKKDSGIELHKPPYPNSSSTKHEP